MLRLALLLALVPALAQAEITGKPAILDGDSIEIGGQAISLHGIDAPESGQTCLAEGRAWRCGFEAEAALAFFVAGNWVTCIERGRDDSGAVVAVCYAGGIGGPDLARWLVAEGWALADPDRGSDYARQEDAARAAGKGLWRGSFVAPWRWRRGERLAYPAAPPPMDCNIKGTVGARGERIYHLPGDEAYDRAAVDAARGEQWFCTEAAARAAGWRRPGR